MTSSTCFGDAGRTFGALQANKCETSLSILPLKTWICYEQRHQLESGYNSRAKNAHFDRGKDMSTTRASSSLDGGSKTVLGVLVAISFCHLLNDLLSSLLPAI